MTNKLYRAGEILYEDGPVSLLSSTQNFLTTRGASYIADRMASRIFSHAIGPSELRTSIATETFAYAEREQFEIDENNSKRELPDKIKSYCRTYSADPLVAPVIRDAIVNDSSVVLTNDGRLISESIGHSEYVLFKKIQTKIREQPVTAIPDFRTDTYADLIPETNAQVELGFFLIRHWSYYHWVTEFLPNLRALLAYENATGDTPTILVEQDPPDWVLEYLKIAGYEDQVKPLPDATISVDTLLSPPRRIRGDKNYNPCPKDLVWVRDYFTERVSDVDNKYASRIYISRRDADDRRVLNEAELISELEKRGFDTVELSELSISEHISLFQEVDIVVGPHGSGFTNTIFADSTAIFEFLPEERVRHFYYCLAHQLGFDYDFLITPQNDNGDIRIDVERAVKRLDNFIYSDI